jgi:hypothetical protein
MANMDPQSKQEIANVIDEEVRKRELQKSKPPIPPQLTPTFLLSK